MGFLGVNLLSREGKSQTGFFTGLITTVGLFFNPCGQQSILWNRNLLCAHWKRPYERTHWLLHPFLPLKGGYRRGFKPKKRILNLLAPSPLRSLREDKREDQ